MTTYIEALAPYTPAQQMKLAFLVLRKLNSFRGDRFNAIAEATIDNWEEPPTTENIISAAYKIWYRAFHDNIGTEGFAPTDEAIDLAPLVRSMKRNGTFKDIPKAAA